MLVALGWYEQGIHGSTPSLARSLAVRRRSLAPYHEGDSRHLNW